MDRLDVCLVNMPQSPVERPSIALGLLKAALLPRGITVRAVHSNLRWAEEIGLDEHQWLERSRSEDLLTDWLFAPHAFPDAASDDEAFIAGFTERNVRFRRAGVQWARSLLFYRRLQASWFLDAEVERILALKPRIVGCTSMFNQHVASLALLRRLKAADPSIITLIGGANCEGEMGVTTHRNFPWVDAVVSGEADLLVVPLIEALLGGGLDAPAEAWPEGVFAPVHRVAGYPRRDAGDGRPRATVEDMRQVPMPEYDDYFAELATIPWAERVRPSIPLESSRGCWWGQRSHCTFCGLNGGGMNFRTKPADQARAEMDAAVARWGIDRIEMVDNILDMTYFRSLIPELGAAAPPLKIFYETKSNLKREQIAALAKAGVRWIQPGIESLNSGTLKLMGKGVTAAQNVMLLKWCRQYGIHAMWTVIAGFPGEDDAWYAAMAELVPYLTHLEGGGIARLRYDRFSPHQTQSERFGLKLTPAPLYAHVYPLPPDQLAGLAYFFENEGEDSADRSLFSGEMPGRPGVNELSRRLSDWHRLGRGARLDLIRGEIGGEVVDARLVPTAGRHVLDAIELTVLDACAEGPPRAQLAALTPDLGDMARAGALERLLTLGLVVELDGRLVGLVLEDPAPMPTAEDNPLGRVWAGPGAARPEAEAAE
ncbi:MAG: RiPP maturation radical SAM C-methyltransferase [Ferrovibrionaceae bacterium]